MPEDTNNKICTKSNNTAQRNNVASNDAMEWCNYIIWNYIYVIPIFVSFFFVVMLMRRFIKAINSISVIIILLSHINYYFNCLWKYACKGAKYQSSLVFVILSSLDHQQTTLKMIRKYLVYGYLLLLKINVFLNHIEQQLLKLIKPLTKSSDDNILYWN